MKSTIEVEDRVTLEVGIERAWDLITDSELVVACVPGAEIESTDSNGAINGALTLSLGPTETRFQGKVTPTFDRDARSGELTGQGSDGRGRTRASITTRFELEKVNDTRTALVLDSSIAVSGALAGFAATGGQAIARRLLEDFAENVAAMTAPSPGSAGAGVSAESNGPRRLGLFGLIFRSVRDSIGRLFKKITGRRSP